MSKIELDVEKCTSCGRCIEICPANVFEIHNGFPRAADEDMCTLCGICADQCPVGAIVVQAHSDVSGFLPRIMGKEKYREWAIVLKGSSLFEKRSCRCSTCHE